VIKPLKLLSFLCNRQRFFAPQSRQTSSNEVKEGSLSMTKRILTLTLLSLTLPIARISASAQQEGSTSTQALVALDSKSPSTATEKDITVKVDNRVTPLTNLVPVTPNTAQVALLIDDGLRSSVARELDTLRAFVAGLPQGTEVFVGYMQNGRVVSAGAAAGFTTDRAAAAQGLRIPSSLPGSSASPYFCLSDFVKNWPPVAESNTPSQAQQASHKARFVLMLTNGVDPYNGSTSITNQDSPYVSTAVTDAQRAGVPVYSIYFGDSGIRGGRSSFSGQSYLSQLAQATGGVAFYQGIGNPVSLSPYLKQFQNAVAETYVATFPVDGNKKMVNLKLSTTLPKTKLRGPDEVRPGTVVLSQ
jgi:hypothetical protein